MISSIPGSDKCERNTVYLDISNAKLRNPTSRNRSRRYSVSFDGRSPIADVRQGTSSPLSKPSDPFYSSPNSNAMLRGIDIPRPESYSERIPMPINRNIMTTSLIEDKLDDKNSPVNRELAVQLLKEYVKSLKDFSSLLQLRQNRETKDSSTSPIHSPVLDSGNNIHSPMVQSQWSSHGAPKEKQFTPSSSSYLHEKSYLNTSNGPNKYPSSISAPSSTGFSASYDSKPSTSFSLQTFVSVSQSNQQNTPKSIEMIPSASKNGFTFGKKPEVPKKVILRKFFYQANEPSTLNGTSGISGTSETTPPSYSSLYSNKSDLDSNLSITSSISTMATTTEGTDKPLMSPLPGSIRSEELWTLTMAAFHRQYTQMLWPADTPAESAQPINSANLHKTSLELKTPPKTSYRRTSLDAEIIPPAEKSNAARILSPTSSLDSHDSSKPRTIHMQPIGFRRGGSVSPSIRLGPSSRSSGVPQFGKHLINPNSTARVLVSPPYLGSSTTAVPDTRRSFRPFTSALEPQLPLSTTSGDISGTNSSVHHHKVIRDGSQGKSLPDNLSNNSVSLKTEKETCMPDRFVRETPPLSPSIQSITSGTRSSSFDSFSLKNSAFATRGRSYQPTQNVYDNSFDQEPYGGYVQPTLRRNASDFRTVNQQGLEDASRFSNRMGSDYGRRSTLGTSSVLCSTSDPRSAGPEPPKPIASYTRSTTAPILSTIQKLHAANQVPRTAWTTISRRAELKEPLDVKVDDSGGWKSDTHQSTVDKLDIATQTEHSPTWPISPDTELGSNESLQSDLTSTGPVLQTWPLSLQSVVKPTELDAEVEQVTLNGWNTKTIKQDRTTEEESLTECTQTSGSPTPVPSPTSMIPINQSAFSRPLIRRHSMRGALSERPSTLTLGEQPNKQNHRLSLSRPFRSSLGSPTCGATTTETPRCRSVHFSTDVLVAHTGHGPEPLMLSSAPLKEPAPCEGDDESPPARQFTKPFYIGPRRFVSTARQPTESNFQEIHVSINQNQAQPRLPRPTPFRRTLVPRGASEPNL